MTLLCAPTTVHNKENDPKPSNQPSGAQPKQHSVHDAIGCKKTFSAAAYRSGLAREGRKQEVGGSFIVYWRTKAPSVPIHPPTGRAPHVNNRVYSLRRRTFSRHTAGNYSAPIAALTVLTHKEHCRSYGLSSNPLMTCSSTSRLCSLRTGHATMASGGSWLLSTSRHCSAATKQIFIWTLQRICLAAVHEPTTNQYGTQVGSECVVFSRLSRSVRDQPRLLPGCNQITLPSSRILERRHEIAVSANNHGR